jgi:hypothetical protein
MTNLQEQAFELEKEISNYKKALYIMSPKVCNFCHELKTDENDLLNLFHEGMCLGCSHAYGEVLEQDLLI